MHKALRVPSRTRSASQNKNKKQPQKLTKPQTQSKRRFKVQTDPPGHGLTQPHTAQFLWEPQDEETNFILETVPLISTIPYIDPANLSPYTKIHTKSNQDPETSLFNPATTVRGQQPGTVSRHKKPIVKGQSGTFASQFIQHASPNVGKFHPDSTQYMLGIISDDYKFRLKQYNEVGQFISPTYIQREPVGPILEKLGRSTDKSFNHAHEVQRHDVVDSSFVIPIMNIGSVPYALMQLRYATPRVPHLRFLGGRREDLYRYHHFSEQIVAKQQEKQSFDDVAPRSSLLIAMTLAGEQTEGLFSKMLYNYSRPLADDTTHTTEQLKDIYEHNRDFKLYEQHKKSDTSALLRRIDAHTRPKFISYRFNRGNSQFNTVFPERPYPKGNLRKRMFLPKGAKTIGRVIATQFCESNTPIEHDYAEQIQADVSKFNVENHRDTLVQKIPKKSTAAVHLLDLGRIQSTGKDALDPSIAPYINQMIFPQLFSDVECPTEFYQLALYMTQTSPFGSTYARELMLNQLPKFSKEANQQSGELLRKHLSPYSPSLHPLIASINAVLHTALHDADKSVANQNHTFEEIIKILQKHFQLDSTFMLQRLWSKVEELNDSDPQFVMWMLPLIYYLAKPSAKHPSNRFHFVESFPSQNIKLSPAWYEASSLHWVPLQELVRNDPLLAPRFADRPDTETRLLKEHYTQDQLLQTVKDKYQEFRPDIVEAHKNWTHYFAGLPPQDRSTLAKMSVYYDNSGAYELGGFRDAHCVDGGQIMTTSTGQHFPIRGTHHDMVQTPQMVEYFKAIINKSREDSYEMIDQAVKNEELQKAPGNSSAPKKPFSERVVSRFKKFRALAFHLGYSIDEMKALFGPTESTPTSVPTTPPQIPSPNSSASKQSRGQQSSSHQHSKNNNNSNNTTDNSTAKKTSNQSNQFSTNKSPKH